MSDGKVLVSIVIPVFNEAVILQGAVQALLGELDRQSDEFEILLVDDGSRDSTWARITDEGRRDSRIRGVRLSRNFGHDAALFSGMTKARGDLIVTMDCDGQHPFAEISKLIETWRSTGADIVNGVKIERGKERLAYRLSVRVFGSVLSKTLGSELQNATEFKLMRRRVADALLRCGDYHFFYRALVPWVGFRQVNHSFVVAPSLRERSHWNPLSLIRFAISGMIMFSEVPIKIIFGMGVAVSILCLALLTKLVYAYVTGEVAEGYSTLLVLQLMSLGIMVTCVGILGVYVRTTLNQALRRPRAIISELSSGAASEIVTEFI